MLKGTGPHKVGSRLYENNEVGLKGVGFSSKIGSTGPFNGSRENPMVGRLEIWADIWKFGWVRPKITKRMTTSANIAVRQDIKNIPVGIYMENWPIGN